MIPAEDNIVAVMATSDVSVAIPMFWNTHAEDANGRTESPTNAIPCSSLYAGNTAVLNFLSDGTYWCFDTHATTEFSPK